MIVVILDIIIFLLGAVVVTYVIWLLLFPIIVVQRLDSIIKELKEITKVKKNQVDRGEN